MNNNAEFGKQHGLKYRPKDFDPASIGTYVTYAQLDEDLIQVSQLLKYIKFGFGLKEMTSNPNCFRFTVSFS